MSPSQGRAWAVPAAAGIAAAETVGIMALLFWRGTRVAVLMSLFLAVKLPFCAAFTRRWAGAWLALLLWELTGVFAALVAPGLPLVLRVVELALAGSVLALLAAALPLFPRVELPER